MLNQTGIYALRAMAYLAMQDPSCYVPAHELAEGSNVPACYLSKVMRKLVTAGLVRSRKGHAGGFAFCKPARDISFLHVLEAVEQADGQARCFFGNGLCDPTNPCLLHIFWNDLQGGFREWASQASFDDVQRLNERMQFVMRGPLRS